MARFGIPGESQNNLAYIDRRLSTVPCVEGPRSPTVNDKNYPLWTEWRVTQNPSTGVEGDYWKLSNFVAGQAIWVKIGAGGAGPAITLSDTAGTKVSPDGTGNIQLVGTTGQINIVSTPASNLLTFSLAGGGGAADSFQVQSATAPGVNPVVPDGAGLVSISGSIVAGHSVPIETHTRAANAFNVEVQQATAVTATPADNTAVGMASFNDAQFTVDGTSGMVSLLGGGGPAFVSLDVDAATAPGTDPVTATAAGVITLTGAAVANHSVPVETHSRALNTANVEVQVAVDRTGAPGNTNDAGLCSFDDQFFDVNADGYVTFVGPDTNNLIQQVRTSTSAYLGSTSVIPFDNTIPQVGEGTQLFSLAITPTDSTSVLLLEASVMIAVNSSAATKTVTFAIFQDGAANAIYATSKEYTGTGVTTNFTFDFYKTAGTTASTTFTVRYGIDSTENMYINGDNLGQKFGGVAQSNFRITEIAT